MYTVGEKNVGNLVQKRLLLELQSVCNVHVFTWKAIYISIWWEVLRLWCANKTTLIFQKKKENK